MGTFGDSGKNMFQAPPFRTMDLAIAKNWTFLERYSLQFRWEMFNAFNTPSFGTPDNNVTDGPNSFGHIFGDRCSAAKGHASRPEICILTLAPPTG